MSRKEEDKLISMILQSGFFDEEFYLKSYDDVEESGMSAIEHYCSVGIEEDRKPNSDFDPSWYRVRYPDVRESEMHPLVHYICFGRKEGRATIGEKAQRKFSIEGFEIESYLRANPDLQSLYERDGEEKLLEHFFSFGKREIEEGSRPFHHSFVPYDRELYMKSMLKSAPDKMEEEPFSHFEKVGYSAIVSGKMDWPLSEDGKSTQVKRCDDERLDIVFYKTYYEDLAKLDDESLCNHWKNFGEREGRFPDLTSLAESVGISGNFVSDLSIDRVRSLNPGLREAEDGVVYRKIFDRDSMELLEIYGDGVTDAEIYLLMAKSFAVSGDGEKAFELLLHSIYLSPSAEACWLVGNRYIDKGDFEMALKFYEEAFDILDGDTGKDIWLYLNTSRCFRELGREREAVEVLLDALEEFPLKNILIRNLDESISIMWSRVERRFHALARLQKRDELIKSVGEEVDFIASVYRRLFLSCSSESISVPTNTERVLIVGDYHIPQCVRYRIEQKKEQLERAGYRVSTVSWTHLADRYEEIFYNDFIIYYRVPSIPIVVKSIEHAKSLGKILFYEIDDLIFDEIYPPPYSTYGGNISMDDYGNLLFGMPLFRSAAKLCMYGIGSTLPIVERLESLVSRKRAYLHRNALDSHNIFMPPMRKSHIDIFYGSGTLAHNSDFIEIALPAIEKILEKYEMCRFTVVGHLSLPDEFLRKFGSRVVSREKTGTIEEYWVYLRGADINLAVLQSDEINDAKSELKWFEAACFRIPSIVSDTKNYLDVVENGVDALVAGADSTEWYEALERLVRDDELREDIGTKAYERVIRDYSIERLADNIDFVIKDSIGGDR
jgi:tetratricopeptide (TPR) repeat protein